MKNNQLQLSIVIPTFNESKNIELLVKRLDQVLEFIPAEYIFVDDNSPDGTADVVRQLAKQKSWIRVIERIDKRGLASACADGVMAAAGRYVLIMDADLQHDERIIPEMFEAVSSGEFDVCSGTRFDGESTEVEGLTNARTTLSNCANLLARVVSGQKLLDPMSGFFLFLRKDFMAALPNMAVTGYKIYFDYLCSSKKKLTVKEIPYTFKIRVEGESKLDLKVIWEYVLLLGSKLSGGILPVRFIGFAVVGCSGVVLHYCLLYLLHELSAIEYLLANSISTYLGMMWNYFWNNQLTYMHIRKRGVSFFYGMILFMLISSAGAVMSLALANWLKLNLEIHWVFATAFGIISASVWNYLVSRWLVWRRK